MSDCMVKVRAPDRHRFSFVTPRGGMTDRRVHAAWFSDRGEETGEQRAQRWVDANAPFNPSHVFKVVRV